MLHLLGMDHLKLTYHFNGRNMRLTDVYGELIPQLVHRQDNNETYIIRHEANRPGTVGG